MKVKWRNETANYIQVANAIKVIKIRRHNLKIIGRTAPDPDVCENNTSFQFLNQIFFFWREGFHVQMFMESTIQCDS